MKKKVEKWIYSDPSVRLPYFMMKHKCWRKLSCAAQSLYCYMRLSMYDMDTGYTNTNECRVAFGPSKAPGFGASKYYRAINELLTKGFVDLVSKGSHGKKAVYDMMTLRWLE